MTEAEFNEALEQIGRIERMEQSEESELAPESFGGDGGGLWSEAKADMEEELRKAARTLSTFVKTEDKRVGTVRTDLTGDMCCIWAAEAGAAARRRHLEQFQRDFTRRVQAGRLLAAAVRAALAVSLFAASPLGVLSVARAARAACNLVEEVQKLRASLEGA